MKTTRDMSKRHEDYVAGVLGGRRTRNSGASWVDQGDGKQHPDTGEYYFGWDCKATLAASISISRAAWDKAVEQTREGRTAMPLRLYTNARLTDSLDLIVCSLDDFADLQTDANEACELRAEVARLRAELEAR